VATLAEIGPKGVASATRRYLIANDRTSAEPVSLGDLAAVLELHPAVEEISQTELAGSTLLVEAAMPAELADRLRAAFAGRLIVEEDARLQPVGA
jgi:hypothetical protein